MFKKLLPVAVFLFFIVFPCAVFAHQPQLIYLNQGDVFVDNPELSQAFYDELNGEPKNYFVESKNDFNLYLNILVPIPENFEGRYSVNVYMLYNKEYDGKEGEMLIVSDEEDIYTLDGLSFEWQEYYEKFGRDYYLKGPEFSKDLTTGRYRIEVFPSEPFADYKGKYVLAIGKTEAYDAKALLNVYWQLPLLKIQFFKTSPLQFFLTPFGIAGIAIIGGILIFLALIYYLMGAIKEAVKHRQAKTLLLTSAGMQMKQEIIKLLQKPAYNVTVGFITTAAKPQPNLDYLWNDWSIMKDEMGFNIEEVDIEGKTEAEVEKLLKLKDIIFVEGGNTFYLLKAMRACNFEKIIRKLLKQGKVYVGASAGSIVAGRTIKTAGWKSGDKNIVGLKNLKGLNLVPFDIFVHFQPEHAEIIKQKIKNPKKRQKKLRILTDEQAILVQGKDTMLIGKGDAVVV